MAANARATAVQHDEDSEEETNPCGYMWMEGDSLAPPCQSDRDIVEKIVEIAQVTPADVRCLCIVDDGMD